MINQHYTGHRGQRHAGSDAYCPARPAACVFARYMDVLCSAFEEQQFVGADKFMLKLVLFWLQDKAADAQDSSRVFAH